MRKKMSLLLVSLLLPLLAFGLGSSKVIPVAAQSSQTWKCPKCGLGNTSHRAWGCRKCHWPYDM